MSEDPIGSFLGDTNLYTYTDNNPLIGIDPLGLWAWPSNIYNEANDITNNLYPKTQHNGPGDAFRHCYATCRMTEENGSFLAASFAEANELKGDWLNNQPACERTMDTDNNVFGMYLGQNSSNSGGDCFNKCSLAADNGTLTTIK